MINDTGTWVIIPNLNGENMLADCINGLLRQLSPNRIVVVDNGSTDKSVEVVKEMSSEIAIITNSTNKGFTGGVNPGIEYAINKGAEFVALLNNDAIAKKSWLKQLLKPMSDGKLGIVTSKMLLTENTEYIDTAGLELCTWGIPFPRGRNEPISKYADTEEVFGASGGASLYRVDMLKQIGIFDDDYFAYMEDVDISFRAQAAGWKVVYEPNAIVSHKLSQTAKKMGSNFSFYHFVKNLQLLYFRNMPAILFVKYLPLFTFSWLRLAIGSIVRGQIVTFIKANVAAVKLLPNSLKQRKIRNKLRVLTSSEIDKLLYHGPPPRPPKL